MIDSTSNHHCTPAALTWRRVVYMEDKALPLVPDWTVPPSPREQCREGGPVCECVCVSVSV